MRIALYRESIVDRMNLYLCNSVIDVSHATLIVDSLVSSNATYDELLEVAGATNQD